MKQTTMQHQMIRACVALQSRVVELGRRRERGDVPGWVLVTLMTALLVVGLLAIARDKLATLLNTALDGFS